MRIIHYDTNLPWGRSRYGRPMILRWACSLVTVYRAKHFRWNGKPITHLEPAWQEAQSRTLEERSGYVGKHESGCVLRIPMNGFVEWK